MEQMQLNTVAVPVDEPKKKNTVRDYADRKVVSYLQKYEGKIIAAGEDHINETTDELYELLGAYQKHISKRSFKLEVARVFIVQKRKQVEMAARQKQEADKAERDMAKKINDDRVAAIRAKWDN